MKLFKLAALPAAALINLLLLSPVQASYVCTGLTGPADPGTPYFNGDLTDTSCDITEIEVALFMTPGSIDESLILGSKSNSSEDGNGDINGWGQDEFGLGTLTVTSDSNTSGTWELTGSTQPLFFVDKYDGGYDVYLYMGDPTSPFSDSWDGINRGNAGVPCGSPPYGPDEINCGAATSHIAVYGVVPIPAAVWLFGTGLLGLVGVARRKRV